MHDPWPDWMTPERAGMRQALSSRQFGGRCCVCRHRRRCRYDLVADLLFCSEDCWEEHQRRKSGKMSAVR